jgi:predicted Zn-dependent peptidase
MYYRAGFRLEPEGRTGFAHLFEHLMFQGTTNVPKADFGRLVNGAGGLLNGTTRHDYTTYFEVLPASALEMACYIEADRMGSLDLNWDNLRNQVDVVKEEVRVNVLNQPYGGFSWLWLSQYAFSTYPNAHNFYGEFADLEAATVADARSFYETWYGPGNASLILVGDFEEEEALELVEHHFGPVPARPAPPSPSVDEPVPQARAEHRRRDPLAPTPRVAVGYRTAPFGSPDHLPLALAARILTDGRSSRLQRRLIRERELLVQIAGGPHYPIGDSFEFNGPALFVLEASPRPGVTTEIAVAAIDEEVARLAEAGPTADELLRAKRRELGSYHANCDSRLGRSWWTSSRPSTRGSPSSRFGRRSRTGSARSAPPSCTGCRGPREPPYERRRPRRGVAPPRPPARCAAAAQDRPHHPVHPAQRDRGHGGPPPQRAPRGAAPDRARRGGDGRERRRQRAAAGRDPAGDRGA